MAAIADGFKQLSAVQFTPSIQSRRACSCWLTQHNEYAASNPLLRRIRQAAGALDSAGAVPPGSVQQVFSMSASLHGLPARCAAASCACVSPVTVEWCRYSIVNSPLPCGVGRTILGGSEDSGAQDMEDGSAPQAPASTESHHSLTLIHPQPATDDGCSELWCLARAGLAWPLPAAPHRSWAVTPRKEWDATHRSARLLESHLCHGA